MKRFHVHLHVEDLTRSIGFYSKLFAAEPTRVEPDYAKWMLEDPRVNFAISTRGSATGIDHLGFQTDDPQELAALKSRAQEADLALADAGESTCCYARSDKHWITDPQGIAWEQFHTLSDIPVFSEGDGSATAQATASNSTAAASACCAPAASASTDAAVAAPMAATRTAPRGKPLSVTVKAAGSCC